ncbi:MAG: glycosyltransferase family 39 protein [Planctomycetes bacterium]|nr:glycosyltransferase family 39 protein [Planctomycetota bacterium]
MSENKAVIFVILITAFLLRFTSGLLFITEIRGEFPVSTKNDFTISDNLISGHGYSLNRTAPTAIHLPLYPLLLALLKQIWNDGMLILLIHSLIGTVTVFSVYLISKELFQNSAVSKIASLVIAIYPYQIRTDLRANRLALYIMLLSLAILLFIQYYKNQKLRNLVITSFIFALAFLTKEDTLPIVLGIIFYFIVRRKIVASVLFTAVFCILCSPWWIRNYISMGHTLLSRTDSGPTLFTSNCELTMKYIPDYQLHVTLLPYIASITGEINKRTFHCEVDKDQYYFEQTKKFIRGNPIQYIKLCLWRLVMVTMPIRKPDIVTKSSYHENNKLSIITENDRLRTVKNVVYFLSYGTVLIFGLMGLEGLKGYQLIPFWILLILILFYVPTVAASGMRTYTDFILAIYAGRSIANKLRQ